MSRPFDGKTFVPSQSNPDLSRKLKNIMLKHGLDRKNDRSRNNVKD